MGSGADSLAVAAERPKAVKKKMEEAKTKERVAGGAATKPKNKASTPMGGKKVSRVGGGYKGGGVSKKGVKRKLEDATDAEGLSKSQNRKQEKRRRLLARKPERYTRVLTINKLYGALLQVDKKEKEALTVAVTRLLEQLKGLPGSLSSHLALSSISRAFQVCLKFGSETHRKEVFGMLQGHFIEMCTDVHAHRLCMKLVLYGTSAQRVTLAEALCSHSSHQEIFFSKFGCAVWEYLYRRDLPTTVQRRLLCRILIPRTLQLMYPMCETIAMSTFYAKLPNDHQTSFIDHLENVVGRASDKELLDREPIHVALRFLVVTASEQKDGSERTQRLLDCVWEGCQHLASTKAGVEALCYLLGYADAKQKKGVIKSMYRDGSRSPIELSTSPIHYLLTLRLLDVVDDTRLLLSSILQPTLEFDLKKPPFEGTDNLWRLASDSNGRKILLRLLAPDRGGYLAESDHTVLKAPSPASKKDSDTRRQELLEGCVLPCLAAALRKPGNVTQWLKCLQAKDVVIEYLRHSRDTLVVDALLDSIRDQIQSVEQEKEEEEEADLCDHSVSQRALVACLRIGCEDGVSSKPLVDGKGRTMSEAMLEVLGPSLRRQLTTRGVFVVLAVLKLLEGKRRDELATLLRSTMKDLGEVEGRAGLRQLREELAR